MSDDLGGGQLFSWLSTDNSLMITNVQNWLDNPSANFGWMMIGDEANGQTAKRFNSGESNLLPNLPPQLLITFDEFVPPPPAPEPGAGAMTLCLLALAWAVRRRGSQA